MKRCHDIMPAVICVSNLILYNIFLHFKLGIFYVQDLFFMFSLYYKCLS